VILNRQIVTVLGARSGTSALAGTLGIVGCTLPKTLMAANWANKKGYFEPEDIAACHDKILATVGSSWSDWREFPPSWFSSPDAVRSRDELVSLFIANYDKAPLSVLKEPRMCRMLPLWNEVFKKLDSRPLFCFIDRSPLEVAASLKARDGSSIEQGLLYYIRNHLDAEFQTRFRPRAFVSYNALLKDWRQTVAFVSDRLNVPFHLSGKSEHEVDIFLESDLKNQKGEVPRNASDPIEELAFAVTKRLPNFPEANPTPRLEINLIV